MPLYEYRCPWCGEVFDLFRPLDHRDNPVNCPHCGREDARRELSRVSASVKGTAGSCPSAPVCGANYG